LGWIFNVKAAEDLHLLGGEEEEEFLFFFGFANQ